MTPAEVLNGAAELIERDGLYKGRFHAPAEGGYQPGLASCAVGAMYVASGLYASVGLDDWEHVAFEKARKVLRRVADTVSIDVWNDAPERTADDVVAKLREAAAAVSA